MASLVSLSAVSKSFDDAAALQPLTLSIERGQTTVLIGPSGCGKSTLIRLIVGLVQPDSGRIEFNGEVISPSTIPALRRRIGYVIQEGGLFPHLTARANIQLMARHLGQSRTEMDSRVEELAALTHFPIEGLDRYPVEVSGGQRQ